MLGPATPWGSLFVVFAGGPSPLLAEGPGRSSPPFLTSVCCWRWWSVPCQIRTEGAGLAPRRSRRGLPAGVVGWFLSNPGGGSWAQFPAICGWVLLLGLVGRPSRILVQGSGRSSPAFPAAVCRRDRWVVPCRSWGRVCAQRWLVVPRQSWWTVVGAVPRHAWFGGTSPLLAEGPGCSSPGFLSGVCCWW